MFGRKRTAQPVAQARHFAPPPMALPTPPESGCCDQCAGAQYEASFGAKNGTILAQMLVYCLSCGSYWLASGAPSPASESTRTDEARARHAALHTGSLIAADKPVVPNHQETGVPISA
jgi:hypothetical protein